MDRERWERVSELFGSICELDHHAREARLAAIAAGDPALADDVRSMLAADGGESPLDRHFSELLPGLRRPAPDAVPPRVGRLGAWELHERIGSGGMGEVYRATRAEGGFAQEAAIKLLKRGMDSEQILARFLRERRILAGLHHPNIAQLYDGGISDDGLPWFAMEYVDGRPITSYCEAEGCGIAERIDLVVAVCQAIDVAHRNLVVHRDLKPANVLVDAAGTVKLLDFGIAKLLDQGDGELQTEVDMRVLTPAYAAPEQLRGDPVTTATDVYALGLLLYELLTGELPPEQRDGSAATASTITAPSQLARRSAATGDGAEARRRVRALEGDIDTIVLTALQPEPARRYPGPAALASDLQRWRSGRPVSARRDSRWYRARKFVARNRALVALSALLLIALLAGLGAALWQARRASAQAALAQEQTRIARAAAERADRGRSFLVSLFQDSSPYRSAKGDTLTAAELLSGAAGRVDTELADYPLEQAELRVAIGSSLLALGQVDLARALIEKAIAQLRTLPSVPPRTLAGALQQYVMLTGESAEVALATGSAREALRLLEGDDSEAARLVRVQLRTSLAKFANLRGDSAAALAEYRAILDERTAMFGSADDPRLAVDWNNIGSTHLRENENAEAAMAYRHARRLLASDGGERQPRMIWVELGLGAALNGAGQYAEGAARLDRVDQLAEALLPPGHFIAGAVASARSYSLLRTGDPQGAEREGARAVDILRKHNNVSLPHAQLNHAAALLELGRAAEAAVLLSEAVRGFEAASDGPADQGGSPRLHRARAALGVALVRTGRRAEGERMLEAAMEALRAGGARGAVDLAETHLLVAQLAQAAGDDGAAAEHRSTAATLFASRWGDAHPRVRGLRAAAAPAG